MSSNNPPKLLSNLKTDKELELFDKTVARARNIIKEGRGKDLNFIFMYTIVSNQEQRTIKFDVIHTDLMNPIQFYGMTTMAQKDYASRCETETEEPQGT